MKTFIHPTDIPVIAKIFHPISDTVFVVVPPNTQYNLANISTNLGCTIRFFVNQQLLGFALDARADQAITVLNLHPDGIDPTLVTQYPALVLIDIFGKQHASTSFDTSQFDFINNTDGTIRWMYNHLHKRPIFLNLYNTSNWKGELFKTVFKTGFKVGVKNWLKSGSLWITASNELFLDTINHKGQYAIFTGTVGDNRKAVISFEQGQKATRFLKMPLTKSANKLVENELAYLQQLQGYKLRKMVAPKPKKIGNSLMVSNVRPEQPINNNDLKEGHLAALYELYENTVASAALNESSAWLGIQQDLAMLENVSIINDLPKEKIARIKQLLKQLAQQLHTNDFVPMSIAHGDLTPWNSYLTDKAVHVYDWELAERLPLFYDAFHYIFQSSILMKRLPFLAIERQIEAFAKMPIVERMIGEFELNYEQAYQFYLLRNTAYYVRRYVGQPHLHTQAHWLVNAWLEALENVTYVGSKKRIEQSL
ncbi:MAG: hypothetical protein AB8G86_15045 [Saprospiraceae bacterium]